MKSSTAKKYRKLQELLCQYDKIAVAFSGGVDSTLMLHAAVATLGQDKVIALYVVSTLNSAEAIAGTRNVFARNFPQGVELREIQVSPLLWQEFVANTEERCYLCKTRMYTVLRDLMKAEDCSVLVDGTNIDDVREGRPGLRAIRELQVKTPLADAGFCKKEIRDLAKNFALSNFDLPSNSCLATRIPNGTPITEISLRKVEKLEYFLHKRGFYGCRVRIGSDFSVIEIQEKDFTDFVMANNRDAVQSYFESMGLGPVVLSLRGR